MNFSLTPFAGKGLNVTSPIDGALLARLKTHSPDDVTKAVRQAESAFNVWRLVPTPKRGRLVGILGEVLREHKDALGKLTSIECGKILSEGLGEVQEMIDVCDVAVGLSRRIGGEIFASELKDHNLQETWHPKGVVGIITAFNFPVAVWAWNFAISVICGNSNIWKPSEKTPLTALVCQHLFEDAAKRFTKETGIKVPKGLSSVILGDGSIGAALVANKKVKLVSATGSTRMGEKVRLEVSKTLGRDYLLELGGNNAVILTPSANFQLALTSTLFGAVGTAGQRCTTTRRLIVHTSIYKEVCTFLSDIYAKLETSVGNPLQSKTLIGPLIDKLAFDHMQTSLAKAKKQGGKIIGGNRIMRKDLNDNAYYVSPALVKLADQKGVVMDETFAPILYVLPYKTIDQAIAMNNAVEQGLSASIFTTSISEANIFLRDADNGIVNVNNGTSGAELGGAFGGNKATGGGREAGSDSWKAYMTRATNRINYMDGPLQLAQGVQFPVKVDAKKLSSLTKSKKK